MANDLNVSIGAEIDGLQKGLDQAGKELTKFEGKIKNLANVGTQLQSIGKSLSIGLSAPLTLLGGLAVKTFANFSQEMAKVKAISGATEEEFKSLRKSAEDLGASTRYSATEVAGLQLNLSKLGFNTQAINASTGAILNLALATGEDLAQSATVAASAIQAFDLSASDAGRVADVMAKSFSSSALDLNKFQVAMASVAPVAKTAGQSIESTTGYLSVLVNAGIDASTAGTSLRNIFLQLSKKGITMEQAFNEINTSVDKNATAMKYFGTQGAAAAVVLADNSDAAADFAKQYLAAGGSAEAMAKIMDNTLTGAFANLSSATEGAQIAIGEILAPTIGKVAKLMTSLVGKFKDLTPTMQKVIVVVGALGAALGPVLAISGVFVTTVLPGLVSILRVVITSMGALNAVILANPIAALGVAIIAVVGAIYLLNKETKQAIKETNVLNQIRKEATGSIAGEMAAMDSLLKVAKNEALSRGERQKAINQINEIYPSFIENITLETINTQKGTEANEAYTKSLNDRAMSMAAMSKKTDLFLKKIEMTENALTNDRLKASIVQMRESGRFTEQAIKDHIFTYGLLIAKQEKDIESIDEQIASLDKYIIAVKATETAITSLADASEKGRSKAFAMNVDLDFTSFEDQAKVGFEKFSDRIKTGFKYASVNMLTEAEIFKKKSEIVGMELSEAFSEILRSGLVNGIGDAFSALGDAFATGQNALSAVGSSLLSSLGGILVDMGKMAITVGVGLLGIKVALQSLNPYLAIAAGAALVALGSFFSSKSKAIGGSMGGGGGSGGGSVPSGSGGNYNAPTASSGGGGFSGGTVVFEISGQKLVGVLSNTLDRNRRSGGNLSFG